MIERGSNSLCGGRAHRSNLPSELAFEDRVGVITAAKLSDDPAALAERDTVKTDDPQLEKSQKEMFERIEKMDKLTLATLRSHLLAEQCMNDYIITSGVK